MRPLATVRGFFYGRQWAGWLGTLLGQVGEGRQADRLVITGDGGKIGTINQNAHQILSSHIKYYLRTCPLRCSQLWTVNFCYF